MIIHQFRELFLWSVTGGAAFSVLGNIMRWFPVLHTAISAVFILTALAIAYVFYFYKNYRELAIVATCSAVMGVVLTCQ